MLLCYIYIVLVYMTIYVYIYQRVYPNKMCLIQSGGPVDEIAFSW